MIKNITNTDKIKINVKLIDGREFLGRDIPSNMTGKAENYISFWDNGALLVYPWAQVKEIAIYEEKD